MKWHKSKHAPIMIGLSLAITISAICLFLITLYAPSPSLKQRPLTFNNPINQQTYNLWFEKIKKQGSEKAYSEFKASTGNKDLNRQHTDAHLFGEALYQVEESEGISVCDTSFSYGCYHSFLGSAINNEGLEIAPSLSKSCFDNLGKDGFACQHGIGHGILSSVGYDFESLQKSLDSCNSLEVKDPIGGCIGGVFMEYNFQTMLLDDGHIRQFRSNEPYFPCLSVEEKFRVGCIYQQSQWWLSSIPEAELSERIKSIDKLCASLPGENFLAQCYKGFAVNLLSQVNYNPTEDKEICALLKSKESEIICRAGVSISLSAIPNLKEQSKQICLDNLSKQEQEACLLHTNQVLTAEITDLPNLNQ